MIFRFNQFTIDTAQYQLSVDDKPVQIEPLVFDLLVYLIENRQRVVGRDELLENLWPGKVVTDSALAARLKDARRTLGDSGARQESIKTIHGRGYQFIAEVVESMTGLSAVDVPEVNSSEIGLGDQSPVQYCRSADGVSIAHAKVGEGYPLVVAGSWMTHLEENWNDPGWGHHLSHLAKDFTLIMYDQRGNGMSDWDNVDISFDRMVDDLQAVIDIYGQEKVAIFGPSQAAAVSVAYARQHPEKVSHLILYGGYPRGRRQPRTAMIPPRPVSTGSAWESAARPRWARPGRPSLKYRQPPRCCSYHI